MVRALLVGGKKSGGSYEALLSIAILEPWGICRIAFEFIKIRHVCPACGMESTPHGLPS